jgi:hypothetical protein
MLGGQGDLIDTSNAIAGDGCETKEAAILLRLVAKQIYVLSLWGPETTHVAYPPYRISCARRRLKHTKMPRTHARHPPQPQSAGKCVARSESV